MLRFLGLLAIGLSVLVEWAPVVATAAEITFEPHRRKVTVKIDGNLFTEYLTHSGTKPVLYPIIGPSGKSMTRDFPIKDRWPNEPVRDHIWHRSMWFTHGSVNGLDFWTEERVDQPHIDHREFVKIEEKPVPTIVTRDDWRDPDGKKLLEDERTLHFGATEDARWIDFDITLRALDKPVTFGDTKEGSFGLRVAEPISVNAGKGGTIVNSNGDRDTVPKGTVTWGKKAKWVDYFGPIEGDTVGVAVFNHPSSFGFEPYWHVRTYGLLASNPFGAHEFTKGEVASGAFTLAPGKSITLRYRVYLHRGDTESGGVGKAYDAYAKEP